MDTPPAKSSEEKRERKRAHTRRWFENNRERKRETDREWREKNREKRKAYNRERYAKNPEGRRTYDRNRRVTQEGKAARMLTMSRARAKKAGMEHTITADDLEWPTHCPVLGIELNYGLGSMAGRDRSPSLDRHDNSLGYIPGNVRIISNRANTLKSNGTPDELMAVARYAKYGMAPPELADIW